jgi:hypothetical protein
VRHHGRRYPAQQHGTSWAVVRYAGCVENIDEIDFFDHESDSAAFMHLRKTDGGGISIGIAITKNGDLDLTVTVDDARRLGERLVAAANEVAAER